MSNRKKELFNIALALQAHRKDWKCVKCSWRLRAIRTPFRCPVCGSQVKEVFYAVTKPNKKGS